MYLAFSLFDGIGPVRFKLLVDYFGSIEKAFTASEKSLIEIGITPAKASHIVKIKSTFNVDLEKEKLAKQNVWYVAQCDTDYPDSLQNLPDKPIVLFGKGDQSRFVSFLKHPRVAVVGSRKMTSYGKQVTDMLVFDLVMAGCTIVSGLMYGIDEQAHRVALGNNGATIGVWAGGIDTVFTGSRKNLADSMFEKGVILSEFPLGLTPSKGTFPSRNRIVSGLSHGVVVVEGAIDSGSLITARIAASQNREVFAVPGLITNELAQGPLTLIRDGATLVSSSGDILAGLGLTQKRVSTISYQPQNKEEEVILEILKAGDHYVDQLVRQTKLSATLVTSTLSLLALSGIVEDLGEGKYAINHR